jgi:peroxin-11B
MRVGKFVEHFRAAAEASDAKGTDPVLKYCAVGRQLGYAGYLLLDNLTVVCSLLKLFKCINGS